jgi:hypothetical protein
VTSVRSIAQTSSLLAAVLLVCASAFAQSAASAEKSSPPADRSASSLPQDSHEGLAVSADSYSDPARAKEKFGKANPLTVGILPVEVFLRNQTLQALKVDMSTIQLSIELHNGQHQDLDWVSPHDVAAAIAHPHGPKNPSAPRFPIGLPSGGDNKADKVMETIGPLALDIGVLPPMATIHGFLFFDLSYDLELAQHASLYVPDVTTMPANKALMFFEVPIGK